VVKGEYINMNYFISDLHFGHKNILKFDNRPFLNIEQHDKAIIENWNNVVGENDDVYVLGDISWYDAEQTIQIFKQLKGRIHLIKGNHDGKLLRNKELHNLFVEVVDYKELKIDKQTSVVLCHYPIPCFKNHYYGWIHLYGHVHNSFEYNMIQHFKKEMRELYDKPCFMHNVGAMMNYMDYTPRTLEEIIRKEQNK